MADEVKIDFGASPWERAQRMIDYIKAEGTAHEQEAFLILMRGVAARWEMTSDASVQAFERAAGFWRSLPERVD